MIRYLFDTGITGYYINRQRGVHERARDEVSRGNRIGIGVVVLAELYYGIELSSSREHNRERLRRTLSTLTIWPFTESAAARYGHIAAELRRMGRPMQVVDMMIAAIALDLGHFAVVSTDSDLSAVPGLTVENWAQK